jgi:fructosamine-3-kinase
MLDNDEYQFFEAALFKAGIHTEVQYYQFLSGGCVNTAVRLETDEGKFFIKWNETKDADFFEAEAKGLALIAATEAIKVPKVLANGKIAEKTFLLLEYIESALQQKNYWQNLGHAIALLHAHTQPKFGLHFDNFIGGLPQSNTYQPSWASFFFEKRLEVQFGLAYYNGYIDADYLRKLEKLRVKTENLFPHEPPALLHGDLWSGNVMTNSEGAPLLIDPAPYYGHREAEIAFTRLFGGFEEEFYHTYHDTFPLADGFEERIGLYNLYPLMVHVNLFGKGYLAAVDTVLTKYE